MTRLLLSVVLLGLLFVAPAPAQTTEGHQGDVIVNPVRGPVAPDANLDRGKVVEQIVSRTNDFRKAEGRSPVAVDKKLTEAAQGFADYMAKTDRYGHTADGTRPADRAKKAGYEFCLISENIAYQYNSAGYETDQLAKGFFEGWKESPGHRKNMLDPDVIEIGVAIARSEQTGHYYAVQMFARPQSATVEFKIENTSGATVTYAIAGESFTLQPRYTRTHMRCRPEDVAFQLSEGEGGEKSVRAAGGERYVIRKGASGALEVVKQ
jgi:uncharacterized protein YkwD